MTTLHCVGIPWTESTSDYLICAYTQKLVKFGKMMRQQGYRVVLYAGERNEAEYDEHVSLISREEREEWFGVWDPTDAFSKISWDANAEPWKVMNARAAAEISARREPKDLLLLVGGLAQKPISDALPDMLMAEPFVGYEGIFSNFCAFESVAWRHFIYGKYGHEDGRWYDTVIPNYFEQEQFHLETKENYLLYIGRLISRKGIMVARQLAQAAGMRLKIAGPGARSYKHLQLVTEDGNKLNWVDYVGSVGPEARAELMARAQVVLTPTAYIEPFGGVAVEAMLSGTPVVASDWGAFTETITEGLSGYRFHTLAEGVQAIERAMELDSAKIRDYAVSRYSLEAVGPQFARWFERLDGLFGPGWGALPERKVAA